MNLDPSSHDFDEKDLTIKVGTNNFTGYKLFLTTPNDDTDLVNVVDNTKTIPNLTSSVTVANFPVNSWGYRFTPNATSSTGDYGVFQSREDTPIMESSGPVNEQTATLGFAAKIDYTKPSGLYNLKLNFKAIPVVTTEYMQNLDPTICTTDPTVVIDQRDEQPYLIQRLDDGRCWMLDNLNLDLTSEYIVNRMDSTNTNATNTVLGYLKNGGGTSDDQWAIDGLTYTNWTTDGNTFSEPLVNKTGTCSTTSSAACSYDGTYKNTDVLSSLASNSTFGEGTGRIGIFYNYCAASAGSYCYGDGANSGTSASGDAQYDICPAGWRMPTGGPSSEYQNLCDAVNGSACSSPTTMTASNTDSLQYRLSASLFGRYDGVTSDAKRQGIYGFFWSSSYASNIRMYRLNVDSANVDVQSISSRDSGHSVRCILRDTSTTLSDITTMQEMTPDIVRNTPVNTTKQLVDTREGGPHSYSVKKIGDDIWMIDNLLFQGTTMTPSDSNVTTTRTLNGGTYSGYSLKNNAASGGNCYGDTDGAGNGYINACSYYLDSDSSIGNKPNAWYNYAAASAGTIIASGTTVNTAEAAESLCPKGWKLPNSTKSISLINAVSSNTAEFNPVIGGRMNNGTISDQAVYGGWWESEARETTTGRRRWRLAYSTDINSLYRTDGYAMYRYQGCYIRCVAK